MEQVEAQDPDQVRIPTLRASDQLEAASISISSRTHFKLKRLSSSSHADSPGLSHQIYARENLGLCTAQQRRDKQASEAAAERAEDAASEARQCVFRSWGGHALFLGHGEGFSEEFRAFRRRERFEIG